MVRNPNERRYVTAALHQATTNNNNHNNNNNNNKNDNGTVNNPVYSTALHDRQMSCPRSPAIGRETLVERNGVPAGVLPVGNARGDLPRLLVLHRHLRNGNGGPWRGYQQSGVVIVDHGQRQRRPVTAWTLPEA